MFNDVVMHLQHEFGELVSWHPMLNNYTRLKRYAKAINKYLNIEGEAWLWGFVDGTFRGVCRPKDEQQIFYSGYKKEHGIKFQGIVLPNGLIGSLDGPYEGRIYDRMMWQNSRVETCMRRVSGV